MTTQDTAAISKSALLRKVPLFAGLDDEAIRELAMRSTIRSYRPNSVVVNEGDEGDALYVVVSGSVRVERSAMTYDPTVGEEVMKSVPLAWRRDGEHFGEMALIDGEPRMADVVTVEPTVLLKLGRDDFLRCLASSPKISLSVMGSLAKRLRQAADHLRSVQSLDVLGRVSELLLQLSDQYGTDRPGGARRIETKLTHQQMAEQLATSRESVSRAMSSLQQSGAIGKEGGRILVLKPQRLKQNCLPG